MTLRLEAKSLACELQNSTRVRDEGEGQGQGQGQGGVTSLRVAEQHESTEARLAALIGRPEQLEHGRDLVGGEGES